LATLHSLKKQKQQAPQLQAYLDAHEALSEKIKLLKKRRVLRPLALVEQVRAAGERLLEAGALLKEKDRILHARLGGMIQPDEIIDALPVTDAVAVCDFFVGQSGTAIHILLRQGNRVIVVPAFSTVFTWEKYGKVLEKLVESRFIHEISLQQRDALLFMGKELHDNLLCNLAKYTYRYLVTQFVFIPDAFLQTLPLGLSLVCGKEMPVPGVTRGDEELFGEVFPLEYVPCLQAVAVSQHQKRPQKITKIVSVADPKGDLPAAFYVAKKLGESIPASIKHVSLNRNTATVEAFLTQARDASIIILGTHGAFNLAAPAASRIIFHDRDWTLEEMVRESPFQNSPVVILSACEVGAIRPGSDAVISGIPGALISAGAACVVASIWPVVDIPVGYLVERLIHYLGHPGYRPSAALFRALRDLRIWKQADILSYCTDLLSQMEADGSADRLPEQYMQLDNFYDFIDSIDHEHPLSGPEMWGGVAVYGSGWSSQAGAFVGGADRTLEIVEMELQRQNVKTLMDRGDNEQAMALVNDLLLQAEGVARARLLEMKAILVWNGGNVANPESSKAEALDLLEQAEFTAEAEQNEQLMRNIDATRQKIML
jgi:CHAT domain-containing protein